MSDNHHENYPRGSKLDALTADKARGLIEMYGAYTASRMIGVHSETLTRAIAGLSIYGETIAKIRRYFQVGR